MNFDDNITEVFDRYLTGQMTKVEEREFLEQLQSDPALKQQYEAHRVIVAGIREARREELKDYIKQNAKIRYIGNIWGPKWVMSSAAILIILLSAYFVIEYALKPNQNRKETAEATEDYTDTLQTETEYNNQIAQAEEDVSNSKSEAKNNTKTKKKDVPTVSKEGNKNLNKASKNSGVDRTIEVFYEVAQDTLYKYDGIKLTLYKFPYQDDVVIYQTDGEADYLAWQGEYFLLLKDNEEHPLQPITDPKTIKQLQSIK